MARPYLQGLNIPISARGERHVFVFDGGVVYVVIWCEVRLIEFGGVVVIF